MLVVTTYFNPMKSHRRLTNYRAFRSRLNAPLLTVELSFDGQFELTSADADHLIQLSGGDVLWQRERLVNIALGAVADDVENVAWIDCDVVFESRNWPQAAKKALKSDSIIQLFSEVRYLDRFSTDKLEFNAIPELVRLSAGSQLLNGEFKDVNNCIIRQLFSEVRYLDRFSTDKLEFNAIPELVRLSAGSQLLNGEFKDVNNCII